MGMAGGLQGGIREVEEKGDGSQHRACELNDCGSRAASRACEGSNRRGGEEGVVVLVACGRRDTTAGVWEGLEEARRRARSKVSASDVL